MKRIISFVLCGFSLCLAFYGCKENLYAPELPKTESDPIPSAVAIADNDVAGLWSAVQNMDTYQLELTAPEDGEAVLCHYYMNAISQMPDSVMNMAYTYTLDNGIFIFTPSKEAIRLGASPIKGVHVGNNQIALYVEHTQYTNHICTVTYTHGPVPVITAVNKTMPQVGEKVRISGRNLQAVDHVYLPVADGWKEVTDITITSKLITLTIPAGEYVQGSIRCQVSAENYSVYSPAYMFATNGIMLHNFNEKGAAKPYTGTEFEYTIKDMGQLRSNVQYCSATNLPSGHSLAGSTVVSPDSMLSFFGSTPIDWPVATGSDDKKGYVRFSTGDRFAAILARYAQWDNAPITGASLCQNLAIQMDIYAVSDGEPIWKTGYISYRMNKDRNSTGDGSVANTAGWDTTSPMRFDEGWLTYTIPLSAFTMTKSLTLEQLINTLISGNLQTILTVMNYNLNVEHPATAVTDFQMSVANIRLVPINTPAKTEE